MGTRRRVASIEEYVISLQAGVYEEPAVEEVFVEPVEEVVEEPVQEVAATEETVTETVEEVVEEPVEEVVEEVVEETVEEVVEEPVEEVVEEVVEETVEEVVEEPAEEPVEEVAEDVAFMPDGEVEEIVAPAPEAPKKPRAPAKAFDFKIVTADEITQDRYNELKNCAMQYKKLKSRVSKKFDSLNSGRTQFVKFGLAGRTLKVYLNLKLEDTEPKYHCKDQSFKKPYVQVPVLIRVKSGRAVKYAKRLIAQCAEYVNLKPNPKYVPQDYIAQMEEIYKANQAKGVEEAAVTEDEE